MALLNKLQVDEAQDLVTEEVDCPEWGGSVLIRRMTGKDRDSWEASIYEIKDGKPKQDFTNMRAKLVARTMVDDKGQRLYADTEADVLGNRSALVLDRLFKVAQRMNGMGTEAEEIAKN
jgi:hypothetical protein